MASPDARDLSTVYHISGFAVSVASQTGRAFQFLFRMPLPFFHILHKFYMIVVRFHFRRFLLYLLTTMSFEDIPVPQACGMRAYDTSLN